MLTVILCGLERNGLVEREIFVEMPPRVQSSLTPLEARRSASPARGQPAAR
ncbi:hypothetical protein [Streptomyces sulphureus]|uniref:hypothetical protein n=1 Tax=Streptomyces sulphureus TaxID=47758 RepID=UPI000995E5A8